jgi:hypothetical protein
VAKEELYSQGLDLPNAQEYSWAILSAAVINTGNYPPEWEMGEGLTASHRNTSRVSKPEEEEAMAGAGLLGRTQLLRLFSISFFSTAEIVTRTPLNVTL